MLFTHKIKLGEDKASLGFPLKGKQRLWQWHKGERFRHHVAMEVLEYLKDYFV